MLKHFDEMLHWEFLYLQVENVHLVKFLFLKLRVLHYVSQWPYSDSWLDDTVCISSSWYEYWENGQYKW